MLTFIIFVVHSNRMTWSAIEFYMRYQNNKIWIFSINFNLLTLFSYLIFLLKNQSVYVYQTGRCDFFHMDAYLNHSSGKVYLLTMHSNNINLKLFIIWLVYWFKLSKVKESWMSCFLDMNVWNKFYPTQPKLFFLLHFKRERERDLILILMFVFFY